MKKVALAGYLSSLMLNGYSKEIPQPTAEHYEARWLEIKAKEKQLGKPEFIRKIDLLDAEIPASYKQGLFHEEMMFYRLTALS